MTYNCVVGVDAGRAEAGGDQEQAGEAPPSAPLLPRLADVDEVALELVGWQEQVGLQGELVHPSAPPLHQLVP